jgi:hypothetical protein
MDDLSGADAWRSIGRQVGLNFDDNEATAVPAQYAELVQKSQVRLAGTNRGRPGSGAAEPPTAADAAY